MAGIFGKEDSLADVLSNLITLDFNAIDAYEAAIERLEDPGSKQELGKFLQDHVRHTENLTPHLSGMGETVPSGSGAKSYLTQGKVVLGGLAGDSAIIKAMVSNEAETVSAYEDAMERAEDSSDLAEKLAANLEDERRHKAWLEDRAKQL